MRGPRPHQLTMKDNRVSSQRPNPTDSDQSRTGKRTTQKQPTTVTRASGHPSQHASNQHASGRAGQRADRHASGQRQKQTHASIKQAETKLFSAVHMHISPVSSCWYKTNTTTSFLLPQQTILLPSYSTQISTLASPACRDRSCSHQNGPTETNRERN